MGKTRLLFSVPAWAGLRGQPPGIQQPDTSKIHQDQSKGIQFNEKHLPLETGQITDQGHAGHDQSQAGNDQEGRIHHR